MSSALSKISSEVVSRTEPTVTEAEAELWAIKCGFSQADVDSLKRVVGKREIGKYLAKEIYGTILAETHMDRTVLDRMQVLMADIASGEDGMGTSKERIEAVNAISRIIEKKVELQTMQLKAVEIGGYRKPEIASESVGPPVDV